MSPFHQSRPRTLSSSSAARRPACNGTDLKPHLPKFRLEYKKT
ncbi:MAG TPA: hypothetical protein VF630_17095 [Hymenobacter sp.]